MSDEEIFKKLSDYKVVPVVAIESSEHALELSDALIEGGLPVAEVTFRTSSAAEVIELIRNKRPEMFVGAGTVLSVENLEKARDAGAKFGVAPGLNPEIVNYAHRIGLPFIPGVATASEVEQGLSLGCRTLKFFPAGAMGGPSTLKALSGPYAHTGVRFMPTGGVKIENMQQYLKMDAVAFVGGTWIAPKPDINKGEWEKIRERVVEVTSMLKK